jgi:hypothetical protein
VARVVVRVVEQVGVGIPGAAQDVFVLLRVVVCAEMAGALPSLRFAVLPFVGEDYLLDARQEHGVEVVGHFHQNILAPAAVLTVQVDNRVSESTGDGELISSTSLYKILRFLAWDGILCDMGKHTHIELTSEERTELEKLIRTGNAPARTHTRARILLLSDRSQGQKRTDQEVADAVLCCKNTVRNVRRRFLSGGLQAALSDKGWPGASPKFTGEVEAKLVMLACSEPPEGAARWTLRLLADKMVELHSVDSMSHVTVGEILKKTKSRRGE